ncbi:MAG: hypothetical protein J6T35_03690 [Bacteroidales bacterium]|nr:hypothetical protein [Bacteroidales bacterium]
MKIKQELLAQIVSDLGLDKPFVKGKNIPIKNCWHFSTDGNAVDAMFDGDEDFIAGMNRIYVTVRGYPVIILAYSLMDTHIQFVLYGEFEACNRFMHEYVRRTSRYIALHHGENNKLTNVPLEHQVVDTDFYLKIVICYTVKNAPVGGIPFLAGDYPWSSGPLYFRRPGHWSSPAWVGALVGGEDVPEGQTVRQQRKVLRTKEPPAVAVPMIGDLVFPGAYVAYELVEQIFKSCKSFTYFLSITKEDDVDARGGQLSRLSIPMQEMRQHKNELCREMFGTSSVKSLTIQQRIKLARALRARYNSSLKQIVRLTGLVYEEVKDLL